MSNYIGISDARANLPKLVENVHTNKSELFITVHGKPVAKLVPAEEENKERKDYKKIVEKYFGIAPDFPDVTKMRRSRKKSITV